MAHDESLYFIAIIPDQDLSDRISCLKEEAYELFNTKAALKSPPHITLHMPFRWRTDKEPELISTLEQFNFSNYPLAVEVSNYGYFPPRVVFLKIVHNNELIALQKALFRFIKSNLKIYNANYKERPFHPHMTIAFRDLKKRDFIAAQAHFNSKKFQATFQVNNICLLRHDGQRWQPHRFF